MARPVTFVKEHPVGVVISAGAGMMIGPWVLGMITRFTGISISLPSLRGKGSGELSRASKRRVPSANRGRGNFLLVWTERQVRYVSVPRADRRAVSG